MAAEQPALAFNLHFDPTHLLTRWVDVKPHHPGVLLHRDRGLGWWVKLTSIQTIRAEAPEVTVIRTENAIGNAGIAHINATLGFTNIMEETIWQVSLSDLTKFVNERHAGSNSPTAV